MYIILGLIIVVGAILGGYKMVDGPMHMLWQPAEVIIIFGSGFGAFVMSNTAFSLKLCGKGLVRSFGNGPSKSIYIELLALLYGIFSKMQREGIISVEKDIEQPDSSPLFQRFPLMSKDKEACFFIGDTLRIYLTTGNAGELDKLMGVDMKTMHHVESVPAHSITMMAESMPAMGIVACVLGVILTMTHLDAPPAELGHHIGAALAGTFMGVLLCYGFIAPFGAKIQNIADERHMFYQAIREAVGATVRGSSPLVALEYGRRAIPLDFRPTFQEMEQKLKGG